MKPKNIDNKPFLRVTPLGGAGEVNKNMFIYEGAKDIIIVDCGVDFPEFEDKSEKIGIPDIGYLKKKLTKVRGIFISHGHEDHYGALPFLLLPRLSKLPIFASRLAKEFIKGKFRELDIPFPLFHVLSGKEEIKLGDFRIFPFRVNHSVPDSLGFCFQTPVGEVFHVADFKFDLTPVDGKRFDFQKLVYLSRGKVLALFSDCLGATEEGFTRSEKEIKDVFEQILGRSRGQVFITTLSSNISRIQQAIDASLRFGRKICVLGRSIEESVEIARRFNYLRLSRKNLISEAQSRKISPDKVTYLVTGSYGQSNSALAKIVERRYHGIKFFKNAVVIFSADPAPPGVKEKVDLLVDKLTLLGAKVYYYEIQENLHVSGHGSKEDLKLLLALVKPKFVIPIGGNPRHQRAYSFLAQEMGIPSQNIFELLSGEILEFKDGQARVIGRLKLKNAYVRKK